MAVGEVVPPFRTEFSAPEVAEIVASTEAILRSGRLILGPYTEQFESAMAGVAQTEHAVAVSSGSTALEIIYRSLGVGGRQVLVPSNTNYATAAAAANAGADVELYDSGLYPDFDDLDERLSEDTAAAVVVHIGGYITPEMERIVARCEDLGVPLIEDAAHAHAALLGGRAAGSFGHTAAFSFFPTKTITTGEGGVITTDNEGLAQKARQYRDQGRALDGITHEVWGNSWRMTELGAAVGLAQIRHVEADTDRRVSIIRRYQNELSGTGLEFPESGPDDRPSGHKCIAITPEGVSRDGLKQLLLARGVQLGRGVYEMPLHQQPLFEDAAQGDYPMAESFAARHLCLPLWRFMGDQDVSRVIEGLRAEL